MAQAKTVKKIKKEDLMTKKTIPFKFGEGHKEYIRKCHDNMYNILEGAVRSGKTVDNVFAFAHELKTTPDRIHLATGSTMGNAKLNIGDANGFGLEWIFRGQCQWGVYKNMEALIIKGASTNFKEKVVIFAGAETSICYKKIRGNSYGMWIATEINLHHDNSIKESFNRTLASKNRKIFWDMNPEHPKAPIYVNYLDVYEEKARKGELKGGYNYAHFTIFDNVNISQERIDEIVSQYDETSIWFARDILGKRSIADGLVYTQFASMAAQENNPMKISVEDAIKMSKDFMAINVGVDFGGNGSGHSFVCSAPIMGYSKLIALKSEIHKEELDPETLGKIFVKFIKDILDKYGRITHVYCDSAEQVLIRGLRKTMARSALGDIKIGNARKARINDRIFCFTTLVAQGRFMYTDECETLEDALNMAVWKPNSIDLERLDDGTSDIDTLDGFEYTYERDMSRYIKSDAFEEDNRDEWID